MSLTIHRLADGKNFQKIFIFLFICLDDINIQAKIGMMMVRQRIYIYAWPLVYNADTGKFFDKLTVKPNTQRKCSSRV